MALSLEAQFEITSEHSLIYWWPLLFEVMQRFHFTYASPDYSDGRGIYMGTLPGMVIEEPKQGMFQDLWNEVYSGQYEGMDVWFWSQEPDFYDAELSLRVTTKNQSLVLSLTIAGNAFHSLPVSAAIERLRQVLDCLQALYHITKPCTGEVCWVWSGEADSPWATFGKKPEVLDPYRSIQGQSSWIWKDIRESEQQPGYPLDAMYVLDPLPLPREQGTWEWVSLAQKE